MLGEGVEKREGTEFVALLAWDPCSDSRPDFSRTFRMCIKQRDGNVHVGILTRLTFQQQASHWRTAHRDASWWPAAGCERSPRRRCRSVTRGLEAWTKADAKRTIRRRDFVVDNPFP
jgi:hypothetical protein